MAARIDWPRWLGPLFMVFVAAPVGILAGYAPEMAILVAFGLAFVLIVFANLANGVALFTLLTFFELLPGLAGPALSFTKIAGLLLALAWLATLTTRGDARVDLMREHPFVVGILVLFIAWAGLSATWAESPGGAGEAVYRFALNAVLFLIVYTAIRTPDEVSNVLAAFVIGATGAALYGFLASGGASPYGEATRIEGLDQNANELASTLVAALVLAGGLGMATRSPLLRASAFGAAAFCMLGVFLTVSRAGLVSLGVAALAAVILSGRWRPMAISAAIVVCIGTIGYFIAVAPPEARERVTTAEGGTGREDLWAVAWRMVEDEPVHGIGAGNFQTVSIHYLIAPGALQRDDFIVTEPKVAHNVFLGTLAELGVVGLGLFLALIAALLALSLRAIRLFSQTDDVRMEILARAHLVALFGFMASLFFASDEYKKQLWLLLSLSPVMLAIAQARLAERRSAPETQ
jgi:O-antigen ligase